MSTLPRRYFLLGLLVLCIGYLGFELFFNTYAMISVDEFWFAHRIYQYKSGLPYLDFSPYKTVLGYYILLIPMLLSQGVPHALIFTKNAIAVLNTGIFFFTALWLTRFFSRGGVLIALGLLVSAELVLSYSTNIRVDLLAYWFCLFSLLLLLEKRFILAGFFLGLGFITSQKAIWYILASNVALTAWWLCQIKNVKALKQIIIFNVTTLSIIVIYIAVWAYLSDLHTVINSLFYEAAAMYQLDWYDNTRTLFWSVTTIYNPILFLLSPLAIFSLCVSFDDDTQYQDRLFIVIYALTILLCLGLYKQVFPYYMQVTIPAFLVLYAALFSWLFKLLSHQQPSTLKLINPTGLWLLLALYLCAIIYTCLFLSLPKAYLLTCLIPMLLVCYITNTFTPSKTLFLQLLSITLIFIGGIYPMSIYAVKLMNISSAYQKANLRAMNSLLNDGGTYVAGIELFYNTNQPIPGLRHLMGPAIAYLYQPSATLRSVMTAALYEDANVTSESVIANLRASNVKFYVNNYRMMALPNNIKLFLASQYAHLWGSIYLYAPLITPNQESFSLKFSGNYTIEGTSPAEIVLNNKHYHTQATLYLRQGYYQLKTNQAVRFKLIPQGLPLNPNYQTDAWEKIIF